MTTRVDIEKLKELLEEQGIGTVLDVKCYEGETLILTRKEVEALMDWLKHEFINYEREDVHAVVKRMQSFLGW